MNITRIMAVILLGAAVTGCSTNSANVRFRGSLLDVDLRTPEQLEAAKPASAQTGAAAIDPGIIAGVVQGILGIKGRIKFFSIEADVGQHLSYPGYGGPDPDMPVRPAPRPPAGGTPVQPAPPLDEWIPPADEVESAAATQAHVSEFQAATTPWYNRQPAVQVREVKGLVNGGASFNVTVQPK